MTGVLDLVSSPRIEALGGSGVAAGHDASLIWTNPAAPAQLGQPEVHLTGDTGFAGAMSGSAMGSMNFAGVVATAGAAVFDAGDLSIAQLDGSTKKISAQRDLLGFLGFSGRVGEAWTVGGAIRVVHSSLFDTFKATTLTLDLGAQYMVTDWLRLGAAQLNAGRGLKFNETRTALPTTWRIGAAVGDPASLQGLADLAYRLGDGDLTGMAGVEWPCVSRLTLRAGMQAESGVPGVAAAAGFAILVDVIAIEYSARFITTDYLPPQQVGLRWAF